MANIPLSDVTLIASALGIFFLIVAFYKSIFHKRRPKSQAAITAQKPAAQENHPVKLADPFQQVPVDSIPLRPSQKQAAPFYPAYPADGFKTVSAFRQFNPNKEFETAVAAQKPDAAYEWE
ncbi:MAG TPA: hypothetical protein PLU38_09365 [Kiritimatiellia bacterium]|jgi:hypothetical protein|nr:MAG: hypothetical protein BWX70_01587 [Verrucomicrobia bacterium ADurb.Bin070]HQL49585.1 hypothetical protein [Kiritimatiellia bacterium]HQQ92060.1 hypothetical protein [Kiritimatiellia bacterium]